MSAPHSACVVIRRIDGRFAAIRSRKHGGAVELPGGKGVFGETPEQTATRECREEVGVLPLGLAPIWQGEVAGLPCTVFLLTHAQPALSPEGLPYSYPELLSGEEGEAFWATREELLSGTYREHTAEWLAMLDAMDRLAQSPREQAALLRVAYAAEALAEGYGSPGDDEACARLVKALRSWSRAGGAR